MKRRRSWKNKKRETKGWACTTARKPACGRLVTAHGIAVHIYRILLGAPEILFGFIGLTLPTPLLHGCETFPFLVSLPYGSSALAADYKSGTNDQANELKMAHTYLNL
jgi:hypothetical protein